MLLKVYPELREAAFRLGVSGIPVVASPKPPKEAMDAVDLMPDWLREAIEDGDFVAASQEEWEEVPPEVQSFFRIVNPR